MVKRSCGSISALRWIKLATVSFRVHINMDVTCRSYAVLTNDYRRGLHSSRTVCVRIFMQPRML